MPLCLSLCFTCLPSCRDAPCHAAGPLAAAIPLAGAPLGARRVAPAGRPLEVGVRRYSAQSWPVRCCLGRVTQRSGSCGFSRRSSSARNGSHGLLGSDARLHHHLGMTSTTSAITASAAPHPVFRFVGRPAARPRWHLRAIHYVRGVRGCPYIPAVLAALAGIPRTRTDFLPAFLTVMRFARDRAVLCNQLGHRAISLAGDLGLWNRSAPGARPFRIIGRWLQ